jgi:hypothetical protein
MPASSIALSPKHPPIGGKSDHFLVAAYDLQVIGAFKMCTRVFVIMFISVTAKSGCSEN